MKEADRQTRSHLMKLFTQHGFNPRTDLGQNFLIDLNLVEFIVDRAHLGPNDVVLEVGAGTGGMTAFLAQQAGAVVSVEYDTNMHMLAQEAIAGFDNITLLQCDALKNKNHLSPTVLDAVQKKLDEDPKRQLKLVSNLPYNIATPIVSNLVATDLPWKRMVVTIQLELGYRMTARPSGDHYGALSVWLQSQCYVKLLKRLKPTVFWPRPKVNSAIMQLVPNPNGLQTIDDRAFLHDFLRRLFHLRRKFMRSVVTGMYRKQLEKADVDAVVERLQIPEGARAEQLEVKRLVELSNSLCRAIQQKTGAKVSAEDDPTAE